MPNFDPATLDYVLLAPQFIVTGLIFVCLSLDLMVYGRGHRFIGWVAIMGLAVGIGAQASLWGVRSSFAGVLRVDDYSNLFNIIFMAFSDISGDKKVPCSAPSDPRCSPISGQR
ncbi:MAG: hypothetical protein EB020_01310 [Proteobacteria bacterium]|nr:hypothetical protein [Pseudomonadota bacterium]